MIININGEQKNFNENITILDTLKELGLNKKPIVVELNQKIVIKENYNQKLSPNDSLEIVTFVGGG